MNWRITWKFVDWKYKATKWISCLCFFCYGECYAAGKTAVKVEEDLKKEYAKKLRVDDRLIPDPFTMPHGWLKKMKEWHFGHCCYIHIYLTI